MPRIVIENERSLAGLNRRLFRRGTPAAEIDRLHDRIRADNPGVDFENLRPGTVVRVPDSPDVRVRPESTFQDTVAEGLERLRGEAERDVASRRKAAREELKGSAAERRAMAKHLGTRRIRSVLEKFPDLAPTVDGAREALLADAEDDLRRAEAAEAAAEQWAAELEVLRRLRP
jgi:hypothetical protein